MPLAIELAAARAKLLTDEQIEQRLRDRFRLLVGGGKSISRHRTLAAVIGWSYEQLTPQEQRLLRLLSVFVGGWLLDGATAMASNGEDEMWVLTTLDRLVDLGLIEVHRSVDMESRYLMLETVRQYAEGKLVDAKDRDQSRNRHLDHYLAEIEATTKATAGNDEKWEREIKRFGRERENMLSAHEWCDYANDGAEKGIRLANGMRWYWFSSDAYEGGEMASLRPVSIGIRTLLQALSRPGLDTSSLEWSANE